MNRFMKKLAPVVSLAALGVASVASAGYSYNSGYCYQYTDGSGYCYGNLRGWRAHAQSTAYTYFWENDSGGRGFYARYTVSGATAPSTYSCTPDAAVSALWSSALANQGRFYINWDANGACYSLSIYNGSAYSNF
ncbi:hypothetical protein [Hyalangium minutum]|uniref:Uncharacterized protein n=1 Tax=Hyalangium minutum TaxID=394096 RepID=A0A085W4C4_9BACT|nr:hypothetical protein [Hyalangium minutum]KFE62537.1 hypothetical protein DB31_3971 [Hyalangium minutum]